MRIVAGVAIQVRAAAKSAVHVIPATPMSGGTRHSEVRNQESEFRTSEQRADHEQSGRDAPLGRLAVETLYNFQEQTCPVFGEHGPKS